MTLTQGQFSLHVLGGEFTDSQIIVLLGENGTGKTTIVDMLAGKLKPDESEDEVPELYVLPSLRGLLLRIRIQLDTCCMKKFGMRMCIPIVSQML